MKLHVAIAVGLVLGLAFGLVASATQSPALIAAAEGVAPIGTVFVNLLKMVVIPLVAVTLFVGVAGMGNLGRLGRLGVWSVLFFAVTTVIAVVIGMAVMRFALPLANAEAVQAATRGAHTAAPTLPRPIEFLIGLIPRNPFEAAANGQLLQLIVFTCLFGAGVAALPQERKAPLLRLADPIAAALIKLVHWILYVAPIGVFALAAPVTARAGWAMLESLAVFVAAVLIGLFVFVAVIYVPAVRMAGTSPARFLRAAAASQLIAFSTTSSATAIPAMLEATDGPLGVSRDTSSLVVSLGATINRAGSALFQGAALVFLAWLYQRPLPMAALGAAIFAIGLVSVTIAGVPSASVITLAPVLGTVGVPLDGLAVLLGVDRIPDMFRTATNVTGDLAASVVLDRHLGASTEHAPVA